MSQRHAQMLTRREMAVFGRAGVERHKEDLQLESLQYHCKRYSGIMHECPYCHSTNIYRNGYNRVDGQRVQRYFCRSCEKTSQAEYFGQPITAKLEAEEMLELYDRGYSYAAIAEKAGVSRVRVKQILDTIPEFTPRVPGKRAPRQSQVI